METAKPLNGWIQSPGVDLVFFSFGWLPVLALFFTLQQSHPLVSRNFLIFVILLFNFLHRHITFPLVYGDPHTFSQRKKWYLSLPLVFGAVTALAFYQPAWLRIVVVISVLWTIYHTVMQKLGILRFYSRKAGSGTATTDRLMVVSWFITMVLYLASSEQVRGQAAGYAATGVVLKNFFEGIAAFLPPLFWLSMIISLVATVLYARIEWKQRSHFSWPRNLYMLSILALYSVFTYDLLVGFAVFGFSHSIEYLAFVNVYARRKYLSLPRHSSFMAWATRRQLLTFGIFCLTGGLIFIFWHSISLRTLNIYIAGSSFLHFLYDGWIWKVRKAQVGEPLGISYATATP